MKDSISDTDVATADPISDGFTKYEYEQIVFSRIGPKGASKRGILAALITFCYGEKTDCFPSQRKLAERAGLSQSGTSRALATLESEGWVEIYDRGAGAKSWRRYGYFLSVPAAVFARLDNVMDDDSPEPAQPCGGDAPTHHDADENLRNPVSQPVVDEFSHVLDASTHIGDASTHEGDALAHVGDASSHTNNQLISKEAPNESQKEARSAEAPLRADARKRARALSWEEKVEEMRRTRAAIATVSPDSVADAEGLARQTGGKVTKEEALQFLKYEGLAA